MKVIIAGGRDLEISTFALDEIVRRSEFDITEVVSGRCEGIDLKGEEWARRRKIKIKPFSLQGKWDTQHEDAGRIRNYKMADYADALILIWDGKSRGSGSMKRIAEDKGLPIFEVIME